MPGYLLLLCACLLVTIPLEVVGARVWRRPRRLLRTVAPVLALFLLWDLVGMHGGHWDFTGRELIGWRVLGGLPVEELLFFVVVPVCALLTWEGVEVVRSRWSGWVARWVPAREGSR
ncbi:MAG: hypothetical protein JWN84_3359 [Nocardioides sp.]|nr:hypothetical protein [Nocardioides sp.]